ncbi:hypothetical protein ACLOJK_040949 [Asimina triloba]
MGPCLLAFLEQVKGQEQVGASYINLDGAITTTVAFDEDDEVASVAFDVGVTVVEAAFKGWEVRVDVALCVG